VQGNVKKSEAAPNKQQEQLKTGAKKRTKETAFDAQELIT
jgi:hypothetical protein